MNYNDLIYLYLVSGGLANAAFTVIETSIEEHRFWYSVFYMIAIVITWQSPLRDSALFAVVATYVALAAEGAIVAITDGEDPWVYIENYTAGFLLWPTSLPFLHNALKSMDNEEKLRYN